MRRSSIPLAELIARVERRLASAPLCYGHGTDNPHDEAAWLVLRGLGLPFDADLSSTVSDANSRRIDELVERRITNKVPAAYLLKEAWLDGVAFYVDERVIVPRSHIARLLPRLQKRFPAARRILDLCTGSGCLAVLAARHFRGATVDAADISPPALAVARKNLARHRLGRRVRLVRSDLFSALDGRRYDLIVSNPPYVAAPAMAALPLEYRHEPRMALAGGGDGLELVARIVAHADRHLEPGGALVCEVGESHVPARRRFRALKLEWLQPEVFLYAPAASR
jgi:ribosomal protein L3 glutamine methyltransferase